MTPRDRFKKKMGQLGIAKGLSGKTVESTEEKSTPKKSKAKPHNIKKKHKLKTVKPKNDFSQRKSNPKADAMLPKMGLGLGKK